MHLIRFFIGLQRTVSLRPVRAGRRIRVPTPRLQDSPAKFTRLFWFHHRTRGTFLNHNPGYLASRTPIHSYQIRIQTP